MQELMHDTFCRAIADARWLQKRVWAKTAVSLLVSAVCEELLLLRSVSLLNLVANYSRLLALSLHSSCRRGLLCEVRRSHISYCVRV
jgi:hypothetical protein